MKNIKSKALIEELSAYTRQIILQTNYLLQEDPELLSTQPGNGGWSVVQVLEHLNSYGRYYLPLIEHALQTQKFPAKETYTAGWLGDYFTKSMQPKEGNKITNKMQAPKNHRPSQDLDSKTVIDEFLAQEQLLLKLLQQAAGNDMEKIRIPISIAKFVRIKLGDTFRFLIAHHQRHFVQASNTLKAVKGVYPSLALR